MEVQQQAAVGRFFDGYRNLSGFREIEQQAAREDFGRQNGGQYDKQRQF